MVLPTWFGILIFLVVTVNIISEKTGLSGSYSRKTLIFYKVNEDKKEVIIYAIVDGRQEYKNLI